MAFSHERWRNCFDEWIRRRRAEFDLLDQIEAFPSRRHDDVELPEFDSVEESPQGLQFRKCAGCGSEFILDQAQVTLHPDPEDPRAVCDICWIELAKIYK